MAALLKGCPKIRGSLFIALPKSCPRFGTMGWPKSQLGRIEWPAPHSSAYDATNLQFFFNIPYEPLKVNYHKSREPHWTTN